MKRELGMAAALGAAAVVGGGAEHARMNSNQEADFKVVRENLHQIFSADAIKRAFESLEAAEKKIEEISKIPKDKLTDEQTAELSDARGDRYEYFNSLKEQEVVLKKCKADLQTQLEAIDPKLKGVILTMMDAQKVIGRYDYTQILRKGDLIDWQKEKGRSGF